MDEKFEVENYDKALLHNAKRLTPSEMGWNDTGLEVEAALTNTKIEVIRLVLLAHLVKRPCDLMA